MNFRKLQIFYETATCLNMSKVAKDMYISQPSISQSINELEIEVGCKLFDRIGRKLFLTHEGEVFLTYTRRILNLYEEGMNTLREQTVNAGGKIVIGASTTIGIYILPSIIKEFSKLYKSIDISIIIENTAHIEQLLLENKVDFAFIEGKVTSEETKATKIWKDELVFICGEEHEWNSKKEVNAHELEKVRLIMREKGSGTREVVESFLITNEIPYNMFLELGNTEAIKNIVEANLGVGCTSLISVVDELNKNEIFITRLKNKRIYRDLLLITHKDKYISKNMELFIEFSKSFDPYK
ncbi:MAG: LysR family transcriptional regulator [Clostridium sp.]